jgi:hypothetical protein
MDHIRLLQDGFSEEEIKNATEVIQNEVLGLQTDYSGKYVTENTTFSDAIKNYINDERELSERIATIIKENDPEFKERRLERAKKARKYKRDTLYRTSRDERIKEICEELSKGDILLDPIKTLDGGNDPFNDTDSENNLITTFI